ncbi:hypothetical protein OHD16_15405 [Sphingobacterium sp. ML3W]|uniref:hypothetical protein n=1 Tax=Sphingobacterium sp. ML3W TaxID=1538644 RepID=UPI002499B95C|nr:hypothetical protein [Sphingobacterium sp. ML3W]WFA81342.1 hypothetical protein OGI71_08550 [Sphingobacterium sp. ML3W]
MKRPILHALRCCALLSLLFSFTSYAQHSKSSVSKQNSGNSKKIQNQADIYVAGACYNETTKRNTAVYWKNGRPVALTDGHVDAEATSIAVVGDDIYVLGSVGGQVVYWKNGQETRFRKDEGDSNVAYSIAILKGDVYVAGFYRDYNDNKMVFHDLAMYWKNGQPVKLPAPMNYIHSAATYIANVDDDIYIIGYGLKQLYWKNGQLVETINELKNVSAIAQLQGNVYAVGKTRAGQAAYWNNGHTVSLSSMDGLAMCIAVSGSDVYVAGVDDSNGSGYKDDGDVGKCWKNGQLLAELKGTDYFIYRPTSIAVSDNDVYIVGEAQIGSSGYGVRFLKNGQIMSLSPIEGSSGSIANFVTSKERGESKITKQNKVNQKNDSADVPQILEPKNYAVLEQYPRNTKISWTPIASATEYEVIIEYGSGPGNSHLSFNEGTNFYPYISGKTKSNAVTFDGAGGQVHRYKIQARNKDKIISTTDWFFLRYIH